MADASRCFVVGVLRNTRPQDRRGCDCAVRRKVCSLGSREGVAPPSLGREVPLCLAPDLLRLDLGRDDGVVYHVRAVDGVDGGHPIGTASVPAC